MGGSAPSAAGVAAWRAAAVALEFLLPRVCVCCERLLDGSERGLVCGRCWSRLALLPHPRCDRCGHPGTRSCHWCDLIPQYVGAARSVCWTHKGTGAHIVHALKYRGWHAVADEIGERMARLSWPTSGARTRIMVPVPLAPDRERERGYNQSERLATALARRWGVRLESHGLERRRSTETQTRLSPADRLANVSGAFQVSSARRDLFAGAEVILVDDVVTTGATLNACAAALRAANAAAIGFVTFGRAPARGDR